MNPIIIVGLVIVVVGVIVFLIPTKPKDEPVAQGIVGDVGEAMKQLVAILDKFDKRYRPGIALMAVGLTLVGLGVALEAKEAKDAAKDAKEQTAAAVLPVSRFA